MIVVVCSNADCATAVCGPFANKDWARKWIKQHNHNPYVDDPVLSPLDQTQISFENLVEERTEDNDHWCKIVGNHSIQEMPHPKFDRSW